MAMRACMDEKEAAPASGGHHVPMVGNGLTGALLRAAAKAQPEPIPTPVGDETRLPKTMPADHGYMVPAAPGKAVPPEPRIKESEQPAQPKNTESIPGTNDAGPGYRVPAPVPQPVEKPSLPLPPLSDLQPTTADPGYRVPALPDRTIKESTECRVSPLRGRFPQGAETAAIPSRDVAVSQVARWESFDAQADMPGIAEASADPLVETAGSLPAGKCFATQRVPESAAADPGVPAASQCPGGRMFPAGVFTHRPLPTGIGDSDK
jgi:hypothetical protein